MARQHKNAGLARILTIIGGILIIIGAISSMIGSTISLVSSNGYSGMGIIGGIIGLIVGLITLGTTGVIKPLATIGFNGIALIVLGVLGIIFPGSLLGGILVIIAGILLLV